MRSALAAAAALFVWGPAARAEPVQVYRLHAVSIEGCVGIPYAREDREVWVDGDRAVDRNSRFWMLDRPVSFVEAEGIRHYRMGSGSLRVRSRLSRDLTEELVTIEVEREIEPDHLVVYLPGVRLPCERRTRYEVRGPDAADGDIDALMRFDATLHESTERLYDEEFEVAEALLLEAMKLRPEEPTPYWMMARLRYLWIEARAEELSSSERVAGYQEAERWADEAVARAPVRSEGYLWQGIARGRIATSLGNVQVAVRGMLGGRGPGWLEDTLRKAVSLRESFRFFGFSTRADALHALAQFYRLAPDAWYMTFVGARGSIDRAIELSREAVRMQPVRIEYRKELAVELFCRGGTEDRKEARRELERVLQLPAITPIDRIDQRHAERLLGSHPDGELCWYSRDCFQGSGT